MSSKSIYLNYHLAVCRVAGSSVVTVKKRMRRFSTSNHTFWLPLASNPKSLWEVQRRSCLNKSPRRSTVVFVGNLTSFSAFTFNSFDSSLTSFTYNRTWVYLLIRYLRTGNNNNIGAPKVCPTICGSCLNASMNRKMISTAYQVIAISLCSRYKTVCHRGSDSSALLLKKEDKSTRAFHGFRKNLWKEAIQEVAATAGQFRKRLLHP